MKNVILGLASFLLFTGYAMAESHGGVITANAQMKAVAEYATNSGGDLYRALKIQKQNSSDLFTISYGGMDHNGKETIRDKEVVRATVVSAEGVDRTVKVEHVSGLDLSN